MTTTEVPAPPPATPASNDQAVDIDLMSPDQLRAALRRVLTLCTNAEPSGTGIPGNGTLLIRRAAGGCQDMPETERVFVRSDIAEDPTNPEWNERLFWPVGGRTEDNTDPDKRWSLGELLWLDDPACDRGDVELEAYLPADEIVHAVFNAPVRTCRVCGLPAPAPECTACTIAGETAAKRRFDQ